MHQPRRRRSRALPPDRNADLATHWIRESARGALARRGDAPHRDPQFVQGLLELALGRGRSIHHPLKGAGLAYPLVSSLGLKRVGRKSHHNLPDDSWIVDEVAVAHPRLDFAFRLFVASRHLGDERDTDIAALAHQAFEDPSRGREWVARLRSVSVVHRLMDPDPQGDLSSLVDQREAALAPPAMHALIPVDGSVDRDRFSEGCTAVCVFSDARAAGPSGPPEVRDLPAVWVDCGVEGPPDPAWRPGATTVLVHSTSRHSALAPWWKAGLISVPTDLDPRCDSLVDDGSLSVAIHRAAGHDPSVRSR